jgi:hypothetical protein
MSLYNLNNKGQAILGKSQKEFLFKAIVFSQYLAEQIENKLSLFYGVEVGISSTTILAEILYKSEFGEHPLAQETYPIKSTKWANNLTLLELDESWNSKFLKYDGKFFKSFCSWESYATHLSDILVFRKEFNKYLMSTTPPTEYNILIENYNLKEFEIGKTER